MALVANKIELGLVHKRVVDIRYLLVFEGYFAVKLVVRVKYILSEHLGVVCAFETFKAETRVGTGAVQFVFVAFDPDKLRAVHQSKLRSGIVDSEPVFAIFLKITVFFEEFHLAVARVIMIIIHQGEYIQFSMSIPIYNRLQGQDNVARKRNAVRKMTAQFDQKQRDVASEVRRAVQDRDGAAAAYDQACRKARIQEEAYQLNAKKMEQGLISAIEYQTATNDYLKAQADEMDALFKYLIKQAVVRYYNGIEYINQ